MSQILIKGHPANNKDGLYKSLTSEASKKNLLVPFRTVESSGGVEYIAEFVMVLGITTEQLAVSSVNAKVGRKHFQIPVPARRLSEEPRLL
ncbi:MAG: hypothetical protein AAF226_11630 [Verrucomicrobiota bacterium]